MGTCWRCLGVITNCKVHRKSAVYLATLTIAHYELQLFYPYQAYQAALPPPIPLFLTLSFSLPLSLYLSNPFSLQYFSPLSFSLQLILLFLTHHIFSTHRLLFFSIACTIKFHTFCHLSNITT